MFQIDEIQRYFGQTSDEMPEMSVHVGAGTLALGIVGMPPRWFVQSVQLNGIDVTDVEFDLTPGDRHRLDITLTDRVSRLAGPSPIVRLDRCRARWWSSSRRTAHDGENGATPALSGQPSRTSRVATSSKISRSPRIASLPSRRSRATRGGSRRARSSMAVGIAGIARRARTRHTALESRCAADGSAPIAELTIFDL